MPVYKNNKELRIEITEQLGHPEYKERIEKVSVPPQKVALSKKQLIDIIEYLGIEISSPGQKQKQQIIDKISRYLGCGGHKHTYFNNNHLRRLHQEIVGDNDGGGR